MLHKETKTNKKTHKNCTSRIVRSSHCNNLSKVRPFEFQVRFRGSNQLWLVEFLGSHFKVARIFQTTSPQNKQDGGMYHIFPFMLSNQTKHATMRRDSWGVVSWRTRQCARPRRSNGFLLPSNDLIADIGYQARWSQEVVWYTSGVKRYGWTPQFITPRLNKKGRPKFLRTKLLDFGFKHFWLSPRCTYHSQAHWSIEFETQKQHSNPQLQHIRFLMTVFLMSKDKRSMSFQGSFCIMLNTSTGQCQHVFFQKANDPNVVLNNTLG